MLAALASNTAFDLLSKAHDYPLFIGLAIAGFLSICMLTIRLLFQTCAEIYEAFYDMRRRCAGTRRRFHEENESG